MALAGGFSGQTPEGSSSQEKRGIGKSHFVDRSA
jgi:hypothetical protein